MLSATRQSKQQLQPGISKKNRSCTNNHNVPLKTAQLHVSQTIESMCCTDTIMSTPMYPYASLALLANSELKHSCCCWQLLCYLSPHLLFVCDFPLVCYGSPHQLSHILHQQLPFLQQLPCEHALHSNAAVWTFMMQSVPRYAVSMCMSLAVIMAIYTSAYLGTSVMITTC